jgi:type I restriction enzyme, S subunit
MKKGWQTKTLGDACRFIDYRGKTPEKTASGLRLITAKNVKMGYLQETPMEFVAPESYESWMTRGIPKMGDVLFTTEAPLANVAQLDTEEKVVFAQRIIVLQPSANNLDRTFLKYLLLSDVAQNRIHEQGTGATVQGIKASLLKTIPIEFPPLPEQQRIVGLLDEAFEGIAKARANTEKNLQNARALFESHLQSVFTQRDKGWVEKTLGDVCEFVGGSQPPKSVFSKTKTADNIRLIQIRDYKSDNHVVYIPRAQARRFCNADDVMIGRYGPPLFQILRGLDGAYNVALMKAVPDKSKLSRDFLFYFLKHSTILQYVIYHSERAAGQIGLTKETLEPYPITLPSLADQKEIVETIMELEAETQRLESIYQQKLAALEALKKSLLHQAFAGQL